MAGAVSIRTLPGSACVVHAYHSPKPAVCQSHHIIPQSWGGKTVASNLIGICPTGHVSVHALLDLYLKAKGDPPWSVREHFGVAERDLAMRAWDAAQADPALHPVLTS